MNEVITWSNVDAVSSLVLPTALTMFSLWNSICGHCEGQYNWSVRDVLWTPPSIMIANEMFACLHGSTETESVHHYWNGYNIKNQTNRVYIFKCVCVLDTYY